MGRISPRPTNSRRVVAMSAAGTSATPGARAADASPSSAEIGPLPNADNTASASVSRRSTAALDEA
jgi:hypothetical protein